MLRVQDVREYFEKELAEGRFTVDRTGSKTIEMISASFLADERAIFGTVNNQYVEDEINWYLSGSTNVNDIGEKVPAAWVSTANKHGEINSNYGHLIYSKKYHEQYNQVLSELKRNPDSRRAVMIYTRPSIWVEYNENGKNDFICTNAVAYYIRDGKLHAVVQMRSNDVVFGYKNDRAWAEFILTDLALNLNLEPGNIYWQVQNLHVYERHFHLVKS